MTISAWEFGGGFQWNGEAMKDIDGFSKVFDDIGRWFQQTGNSQIGDPFSPIVLAAI